MNLSKFKMTPKQKLRVQKGLVCAAVIGIFLLSEEDLAKDEAGESVEVAPSEIKKYKAGAKLLINAVAGVVGLIGGIRIFNKWQNGDQDVTKEIIGWVGAVIFILLVPTVLDSMFGA